MAKLPDLKIKSSKLRNLAMYDLRRFLYARSCASNGKALDSRWFFRQINAGEAGEPKLERLSLILAIQDELEMRLESGGTISTLDGSLAGLQLFFDFSHRENIPATLDNLENAYLQYCEYLFRISQKQNPDVKVSTAYGYGCRLSKIFGSILEIPQTIDLMSRTRLPFPKQTKKAVSRLVDKQNLENIYKMGSFLVDIINGITIEKIHGQLPFEIEIRNNLVKNNSILLDITTYKGKYSHLIDTPPHMLSVNERKAIYWLKKAREPVSNIKGTKRHYLATLRVCAQLIVFIAQTGMNLAQARTLKRTDMRFRPSGENLEVRCYKKRRGGEVAFKIYKSYKRMLQEHIAFIEHLFPDSNLLFPWFDKDCEASDSRSLTFQSIRKLLNRYQIPWTPPSQLRKTRVNWCLRRSGDDFNLTAEMHQHLQETLRNHYELPSQHRTMVELTKFWNSNDPIKENELKISLISSQCNGKPIASSDKPDIVVSPNCTSQSGCLWCENLRDIDSFDYVWSLTSFRHLKRIEAAEAFTSEAVPADLAISKLTEKLEWYRKSSQTRQQWVEEAELRIMEGDYHPNWSGILEFLE